MAGPLPREDEEALLGLARRMLRRSRDLWDRIAAARAAIAVCSAWLKIGSYGGDVEVARHVVETLNASMTGGAPRLDIPAANLSAWFAGVVRQRENDDPDTWLHRVAHAVMVVVAVSKARRAAQPGSEPG